VAALNSPSWLEILTLAVMTAFASTGRSLYFARMSQLRTERPDAGAAKITLIARPYHGIARGGAARVPETGHSNRANGPKPIPAIRCAPVLCLTRGRGASDAFPDRRNTKMEALIGMTKCRRFTSQ